MPPFIILLLGVIFIFVLPFYADGLFAWFFDCIVQTLYYVDTYLYDNYGFQLAQDDFAMISSFVVILIATVFTFFIFYFIFKVFCSFFKFMTGGVL